MSLLPALAVVLVAAQAESLEPLVADVLWSEDDPTREKARRALDSDVSLRAVSSGEFRALEKMLDRGRPSYPPLPESERVHRLDVALPDGREMPAFVVLPPEYDSTKAWPLLLAMHGGPTASAGQAFRGAQNMLEVWIDSAAAAGVIVVAPAMTHVVARSPRTEGRLPYEILRPDQMEALLREVFRRFHVDPDRILSTGISLGSNFSIAFAASRPDRFAAIVPVSTEGDSRETLLRNLLHVPTFVLEGSLDADIRDIEGPRALARILQRFGYDFVYREMKERAHEGFQEAYAEVLRFASARPRVAFPHEVLRVPHAGIMPIAKRVHWIESDTRQGLVRAVAKDDAIEVEARFARELTIYLHDEIVDLDRPVSIRVNGIAVFEGKLDRSVPFAVEQIRALEDLGRPYGASVRVPVPVNESAVAFSRGLEPKQPPGALSFWEMYALGALEERLPTLGLEGEEISRPGGEEVAVRVTKVSAESPFAAAGVQPGDLLLEVGGEPFYPGRGFEYLREWLLRELDSVVRPYPVLVERSGVEKKLRARLRLGDYQN